MVKHDIASKLGKTIDARRSSNDLADELGLNREYLYRMMRALTTDGLFKELGGNREFGHTPLSLKMADPVHRDLGRLFTLDTYHKGFTNLEDTLISGETQIGKALEAKSLWHYFSMNEKDQDIFADGMAAFSSLQDMASTAALGDYSKFEIVTDLGGNHG
eukprot:gene21141-25397_t